MNKIICHLVAVVLFLYITSASFGQAQAAFLDFDKQSISANVNDTLDVNVVVDAGSEQISSIDAYVIYDPSLVEATAITPAGFFPTVINNIVLGRIYIAGLVDDAANSKTGTGSVATISFKALTTGSGSLTYDCQPGVYNSSKVIQNDLNATNIIDCDQSGRSEIVIGSGVPAGDNNINTASPEALPRTGVFENMAKVAVPGIILLLLGGALRLAF